jgi:uncharacterized membrane protein YcaP (DUF421 family)
MEIVVRATVIYAFLFLVTRGMKKRAISDLSPFEMILLVSLGDIIQQGVTQEDMSITGAMLAVTTFGVWVSVLSWLSWRSARARKVIDGLPLVLVQDGRLFDEALAVEHMPVEEILEAARQSGVESLDDIRLAVLEPSGKISIIKAE